MAPTQLKEVYKPVEVHKAFYTGRGLQWSSDGKQIYCQCNESVKILNVNNGKVSGIIGENVDANEENNVDFIVTFILDNVYNRILSAHKSGLIKIWNLEGLDVIKQWKCIHKGPVARLALNDTSELLASGGSDSSIRLWDLEHHTCTHKLIGIKGVTSVMKFYKSDKINYLLGAADDQIINVWDVSTGKVILALSGHYSTITGIVVSHDGKYIASCSRDKVLILWNFQTGDQVQVIPLFECLEAVVLLPNKFTIPGTDTKVSQSVFVATGGEKGTIRIWDALNAKELYAQTNSIIDSAKEEGGLAITHLMYNQVNNNFLVSSAEHNIIIHDFDTFSCLIQLIGFSDEVLDIISIGPENSHIVVATNSSNIKLYKLCNMNCQLLKGHTDLVVSLSSTLANPCLFASSSKDNSVRLWLLNNDVVYCVASGMLHNNSIGAICLSQRKAQFVLSGSQDTILKKWKLPHKFSKDQSVTLQLQDAKSAHDKDINSITVSPNDTLIATASMDKTAKLWAAEDLSLLGTLRGHKRGVWSVSFSPADEVLLTTSADTTLKIWSITDLSCLKTFVGHDSSVLKASFLTQGLQIISSGGDGLLKLWNVKTSECTASFDSHKGKIWALSVMKDEETIITGGDDSQLVIWHDVTEEVKLSKAQEKQERVIKEQQLSNFIQAEDLLNALRLALSLDRPATVLKVFQDVINRGDIGLNETVTNLDECDKLLLLKCASQWNANSKHCYAAQVVMSVLLDEIALGKLKPSQDILESLYAYSERHFKRLTQLLQDVHFIEYTKTIMKPHCKALE